jgi:hypothetical protein
VVFGVKVKSKILTLPIIDPPFPVRSSQLVVQWTEKYWHNICEIYVAQGAR